MNLEESVRRVITREGLMKAGDRVLVAVSGGIDSSVLLSVLFNLKEHVGLELAVAHVNHQLRGQESERDEAFVGNMADSFGVPFHSIRADVVSYGNSHGVSLQHAGRDIRYGFFEDVAGVHGYNVIAIAHNKDDQVETFLLRTIKGTGIHGLTSIPITRGRIVRPLLRTYRSEIEEYARSSSVSYVEDSSNRKDGYERNFLRHHVIPLMEQLNPQFREKILSLLADITLVNAQFEDEAGRFLERYVVRDGEESRTSVEALKALPNEAQFRVVSSLLSRIEPRFIPLREHIHLVNKSLSSSRPNNSVLLPHEIEVKRSYDNVLFSRRSATPRVMGIFDIRMGLNVLPSLGLRIHVSTGEGRPEVVGGNAMRAVFDGDRVGVLRVRTFRDGDRFVPLGMKESTKLKNFFIARKVPKEKRRSIPLLLSGDDIMWVVGERMDDRYKTAPDTSRFLKVVAEFAE